MLATVGMKGHSLDGVHTGSAVRGAEGVPVTYHDVGSLPALMWIVEGRTVFVHLLLFLELVSHMVLLLSHGVVANSPVVHTVLD